MDASKGDAIIIGQSSMAHLESNFAACQAGPLPDVVLEAFNDAWHGCKADVPKVSTLFTRQSEFC